MGLRTAPDKVVAILGDDYGRKVDGSLPNLNGYICTANNIVNSVVTAAAGDSLTYTADTLELMERWLSAHAYTKSDPTYSSRSTAGASGSFIRGKDEQEPYKDMAMSIDPYGYLDAILNRKRARIMWLGKTESEALTADERDV
jgi:hypothetical protein